MEKTINATEAVRKFSEILSSIKYKGDTYKIIRGGKPIAAICPIETNLKTRALGDLREILKRIPRLGAEAEGFKEDLKKTLKHQPPMPEDHRWA